MKNLLIAATQQSDKAHKIVWVGGICAIIGTLVFLYGYSRLRKSETGVVDMLAGGSMAVVGALVAAYFGK